MIFLRKKPAGLFLLAGFTAFFFIGSLGITHIGADMHGSSGSDCPFMPWDNFCAMNVWDSVAAWQGIFLAVPHNQHPALFFISTLYLMLAAGFLAAGHLGSLFKNTAARFIFRIKNRDAICARIFIEEVLSEGILNPKLF